MHMSYLPRLFSCLMCACLCFGPLHADTDLETEQLDAISPIDTALDNMFSAYETVQSFCGGLSAELSQISGVSIAGAVVSGVGTVASGGALAVGLAKQQTDKEVADMSAQIAQQICDNGGCDADTIEAMSPEEFAQKILPLLIQGIELENQDRINGIISMKVEQDRQIAKSKKLGNWRTGLLATSTGTNLATAIIAGLNRDQTELLQQVTACNTAVAQLRITYDHAISIGINPLEEFYMQSINDTISNCGTLNVADVQKIEKRMTAVMGTGIAGTAVGVVGTATSASANSAQVRNDNTAAGKKREKNLNTVANVASGTNVVLGTVETGLNASMITLTKKMIRTARQCEDTL